MLRDGLVCGISDNHIQHHLLAEADLGFKKPFELAQAMESVDRNTESHWTVSNSVCGTQARQQWVCYRCGGRHWSSDCRFKDAECSLQEQNSGG